MKARVSLPIKTIVIACALITVIGFLQMRITAHKVSTSALENMSYLPNSDKIKPFLLGFHTTYACYLWIKTTLYFGNHYTKDNQVPWLTSMVDIVTKLNPKFYPPYEFAGLMIPQYVTDPKGALVILARGGAHLSEKNWKPYFYMSWIYQNTYRDTLAAAQCMEMAVRVQKNPAPLYISLAAKFYSKGNEKQKALDFLGSMYQVSESPNVKKVIVDRLKQLQEK